MNEWVGLAIGMVLTVGTGFFVAAEFALVNLDRHELEGRRDRGEPRLNQTINALKITSTHLSSAQLGITLTTLLTGYTFEPAISSLLEGPLSAIGLPDGLVRPIGSIAGIALATLLSMIIGELVPKNFAITLPLATAKVVMGFQTAFTWVFRPAIALLNNTANAVIRRFGIEPQEELSGARSPTELAFLVRHSASAGLLEQDEATLLDRTLRFSEYDARDLMTPRVEMVAVDRRASAAEIIAAGARSGRSRIAVLDDGPDDIVGFVHVRSAFGVPLDQRTHTKAQDLMFTPTRVPDSLRAAPLLGLLRGQTLQIAVVTDEYGGTAGLVTLEDLVEEIVGELEDEHDRARPGLTRRGRSFTFDAGWRPDELLDHTAVEVPESENWETVAGFVMAQLGRVPELGDEVVIDQGVLRVDRMDGRRVLRIQFLPVGVTSDD